MVLISYTRSLCRARSPLSILRLLSSSSLLPPRPPTFRAAQILADKAQLQPASSMDFVLGQADDDTSLRQICRTCGYIHYQNPLPVAGALPITTEGHVVLVKRDIQPRIGFWTLPAGYMERGESSQAAAIRECSEEARVTGHAAELLALYDLPKIAQVMMWHRVFVEHSTVPQGQPGHESSEIRSFHPAQVPWDRFAFPAAARLLRHYLNSGQYTQDMRVIGANVGDMGALARVPVAAVEYAEIQQALPEPGALMTEFELPLTWRPTG